VGVDMRACSIVAAVGLSPQKRGDVENDGEISVPLL